MKKPHHPTNALPGLLAAALLSLSPGTGLSADLRVGLISYWPLNAHDGGTTLDESFDNDMTVNNAPGVVPGQFGNAFSFNGTSQYLGLVHGTADQGINGLPIFVMGGRYTVAMWVKGAPNQVSKYLFTEGNSGNNTPLFLLQTDNSATVTSNDDKLAIFLRTTFSGQLINLRRSSLPVFDNTWHHIAWVDDAGAAKLYVDGVLDSTDFSYTPVSGLVLNTTAIGALSRAAVSGYFSGSIDDVAIWERPLSQDEVNELRTNSIATPILPAVPAIIQGPVSSTNALGDRVTFGVWAGGNRPLSYQWFKDGNPLLDQTNTTLILTDLTSPATNSISVVVSNPVGSITNIATLVVPPDPAVDVASGLVSYWPFDVATNLPAITPDLYSQNDMALTNMDSANLDAGPFGNALTFDGVEECGVRLGGFPIYNNPGYTIAWWVKGGVQDNRAILGEGSSTTILPTLGFFTEASGFLDNLCVLVRNDAGTALVNVRSSTRPVLDNEWHHIVWTDENGKARLYIDGVLDETDFSYIPGMLTLNTTFVGAAVRDTVGNYFNGSLDEVAQWSRRLTWTEIQTIRTNGIPEPLAPNPPVITIEPLDNTNAVFAGDAVSFTVQATGTGPLSYQWRKDSFDILPSSNPSASNNVLTIASSQPADSGGYSVVITNVAGSVTSSVAQLTVTPYTPATTGDVMKLDFGLTGSPDIQAGFSEMNLAMNGTNFDGVRVTLAPIGGASVGQLQERLRVGGEALTNNPPAFTQAQIFNDFLFVANATLGTGLRILIERLEPNTPYGLTIWSWTTQSDPDRISDWVETASGTPVPIKTGYVFNSLAPPTNNFDSTFGALLTSSASGTLQIEGVKSGGNTPASLCVIVNGLRLVAQPSIRIINAQLVNGKIRLTVEGQYPDQAISLEEKTSLTAGTWSAVTGGGVTETHGPIVVWEVPLGAGPVFYRAVGQ